MSRSRAVQAGPTVRATNRDGELIHYFGAVRLASAAWGRYPAWMAIVGVPVAEVAVDANLVRRLLVAQHPDLAELPIRIVGSGWDNVLARLGEELVVRLPRRAVAAELVVHEQRWLAELAPRLPLPIPVPVRVGVPDAGFPWSWSVCPWFDGESAAVAGLADPDAAAATLAAFLVKLLALRSILAATAAPPPAPPIP